MAELREAYLRYLLAIYELGRNDPDVGIQDVGECIAKLKALVLNRLPLCLRRIYYFRIYRSEIIYLYLI